MTDNPEKRLNDVSLFDGDFRVEILNYNSDITSICARSNNTSVFAFAVKTYNIASRNKLRVKYIERYSSAGMIPKTYNLQENTNNPKALVMENYIQHQIKPFKKETDFGIDITLLLESCDRIRPSDLLVMNAAMIAAYLSDILEQQYFTGRMAFTNTEKLFPSFAEISASKFSLLFCAAENEISFIELEADYFTGFKIDRILKKFTGRFEVFFNFVQDLKDNCRTENIYFNEFSYKQTLKNIYLKFDEFFETRAEIFSDIYESQIYTDRLNKISRISGMLFYEFYSLLHSNNYQKYIDESEHINFFYSYIYKYIVKTTRAKLLEKIRFYCDIQPNSFKPYNIFMFQNGNSAAARLFRGSSESIISVTELKKNEDESEVRNKMKKSANYKMSSNIEKYFRVDDNIENRKQTAYYAITNVFGNIINTLLGESIKSDEYKPLRTIQFEKIIRPFGAKKNSDIKRAVDRIVIEQLSTDGSEVSETVTAFYFLKNWISDFYINNYLPENYICFESAYLKSNNFDFYDPVFFEEHSADARFCVAGSDTKLKYLSMFCNFGGLDLKTLGCLIDQFTNVIKKNANMKKFYRLNKNDARVNDFKIG